MSLSISDIRVLIFNHLSPTPWKSTLHCLDRNSGQIEFYEQKNSKKTEMHSDISYVL